MEQEEKYRFRIKICMRCKEQSQMVKTQDCCSVCIDLLIDDMIAQTEMIDPVQVTSLPIPSEWISSVNQLQ